MRKQTFFIVTVALSFVLVNVMYAKSEACYRAQKDAAAAEEPLMFIYFAAGCLLGPIGIYLGLNGIPQIPEERLIGKSKSYTEEYVFCYKKTASEKRWPSVGFGCGTAMVITTAGFILYLMMPIIKSQ